MSYNWTPSYGPVMTPQGRVYFAGAGGTVWYIDNPDSGTAPVEHRVQHIEVDTADPIDDADQSIQANPGVVMDRNLEGLLYGGAGQRRTALRVGHVDLGTRMPRDLHPEIAWQ